MNMAKRSSSLVSWARACARAVAGISMLATVFAGVEATPSIAQTLDAFPVLAPALTTTVVVVKPAPGTVSWIACSNTNTSVAFVQMFDTVGSVTLGSTVPKSSIPVQPSGVTVSPIPTNFLAGIKIAATTLVKGSVAPGVALDCTLGIN